MLDILKNLFTKPDPPPNLGRNDICWCGSGKKYKHCHLDADEKIRAAERAKRCTSAM